MGNIRTKDIKKASHELIEMYPDRFGQSYEGNKNALKELKLVDSKLVRNKIAGYITRIRKQKKTAYRRPVEREDRMERGRRFGGRGGRGFGGRGRGMGRGGMRGRGRR